MSNLKPLQKDFFIPAQGSDDQDYVLLLQTLTDHGLPINDQCLVLDPVINHHSDFDIEVAVALRAADALLCPQGLYFAWCPDRNGWAMHEAPDSYVAVMAQRRAAYERSGYGIFFE